MNKTLSGKVILVTGSSGGIGRVTCEHLLSQGAQLYVTGFDAQAVDELCKALDGDVAGSAADMCDPQSVAAMFADLRARYGRLDGAFNNAGRGSGEIPLVDMDLAEWQRVININLTGTFLCVQQEIQLMLESGGGSIVNNSSILGLRAGANPAYTAAKHGVCGLTKSAALVYADRHIRVNAVCPGLIEAGMGLKVMSRPQDKVERYVARHPMARAGQAQEVAEAVSWLLSEQSSYTTGHLLPIDGGYTCA